MAHLVINRYIVIIIFLPGESPWWLKNYRSNYEIVVVNPTLAGHHQQNRHAAKPN